MRCWAYVRERAADLGMELPEVPDAGDPLGARDAQLASGRWEEVPPTEARPGDVVLMRLPGAPLHVGLVVEGGMVAHLTDEGVRHDRLRLLRAALRGVYRWRG